MAYTLVQMLFEKGGPTVTEQFPKQTESLATETLVWRADEGSYGGTQITAGKCENGTYRNAIAIFVQPPPGYRFLGTQPFITDVFTNHVTDCP